MPGARNSRARRLTAVTAAALTLSLLTASQAVATLQAPTRADVQRAIQAIVDGGAPGVTAVIQGPRGQERYTAGYANLRAGTRISTQDRGRVGSVTKMFTAALVLKLVGQGKLRLDDTVQRWLPGLVPNGAQITVRELLNHSSGLADYCNVPPSSTLCLPPPGQRGRRWTPLQLVRIGVSAPPTFAPGKSWSYSNTGFVLAGLIVEKVTGRPFAAALRDLLLRPLRLDRTSFPSGTAMPAPFSRGYDVMTATNWPGDVTGTSPTIAWSSGAVVSTIGDLASFARALMSGRVLPPSLLREMKRATPGSLTGPTPLEGGGIGSYGLGLIHYTWSSSCGTWGHTGDFPGYHTLALATEDGRRGAAIYVNSDALAPAGALADLVAQRLLACRMRFGAIGR